MRRLILCSTCCALVFCGVLRAATPAGSNVEPSAPRVESAASARSSAPIEEIPLPLFYLEDAGGKLVPMFGFGLEDFLRVYQRLHGLEAAPASPAFVMERLSIEGHAEGAWAELDVQAEVVFRETGRVRVPLRLGRAVVRGPIQSDPACDVVLEFDEGIDGYVCWVEAQRGQRLRLTLPVRVGIDFTAGEACLRLRVPPATRGELALDAPVAGAVGEVSQGAALRTAASEDKNCTRFVVDGVRGDFELRWRRPEGKVVADTTVFEASGQILVRIDDHSVTTDATLDVQGYGAPFDRFRVRLPSGSELLAGSPAGYRLMDVSEEGDGAEPGTTVEVQLAESTLGPVTVHLASRRLHASASSNDWLELGRCEVPGAARQSGFVAVEVVGNLFVSWDPVLGVRQVETVPESLPGGDYAATFEYVTQPCSLRARIVPSKTHLSVEPEYIVAIGAQRISLEGTLRYTVRGKQALLLEVAMAGWELDEVGPESVVAVDGADVGADGVLRVPLVAASARQVELEIKAHRAISPGEKTLRLGFPQPRADSPGPANIVILAADNVRLVPKVEATTGLTRQQTPLPIDLPKQHQAPLLYRGEAAKAVFVAEHSVHAQTIAVAVASHVTLDVEAGRVEQRLTYTVEYEPCDKLFLDVPSSLAKSEATEFLLESRRLLATVISEGEPATDGEDKPLRMRIDLPEPRMGRFEIIVRYGLGAHRLVPRSTVLRMIPLVMPSEGELTGNSVVARASDGLRLSHVAGRWTTQPGSGSATASAPGAESSLVLVAPDRRSAVELAVHMEARHLPESTVIERAWLQTWLIETGETTHRQDRAPVRFTTNLPRVELYLPRDVIDDEVDVFLDGKPVAGTSGPVRLVPISAQAHLQEEHLLEVRCHAEGGWTPRGSFVLQPLRLGRQTWTRRAYWQVNLPPHVHLVGAPPDYVAEHRWAWNGMFWGRQPLLDSAELARWIGVEPSPECADRGNTYLLSAMGPLADGTFRTANRSWIVFGASGAVLTWGLLLIYVPAMRRAGPLLVVVVVLAAAVALWPAPALLAAQAASLGLALVVVAGLLRWSLARQRRGLRRVYISDSALEKGSTQTQFVVSAPAPENSATTTPPNPPSAEPPTTDYEPA